MMRRWLPNLIAVLFLCLAGMAAAQEAEVGRTIDPGPTGWDAKRPVIAAACPNACPWGELGQFVQESMREFGYDPILCLNCNRAEGPRIVANAAHPPPLQAVDLRIGTDVRVEAPVDFGITEPGILASAYRGTGGYSRDGPYENLRVIAKIEDPFPLLVAVKRDLGVTDLAQIAERRLPVRILSGGSMSTAVLDHYGLTREAVTSWGGQIGAAMGVSPDAEFDVVISDLGTHALNPESSYWVPMSQQHDLYFIELPEALLDELVREHEGAERITLRWGFLRGVDRNIASVGRSGEVVFARDDTPDQAAYDIARAIDENRADLRWFIRPYSYDSRTVADAHGLPVHPGAARYYREKGYIE
jgi:TRAP-type uncharacterized transport system substrate-binding protein